MPAFTQQELDEFAILDTAHRSNGQEEFTNTPTVMAEAEEVMESNKEGETRHETRADMQDILMKTDDSETVKDEANEVFAEASEHLAPQESPKQQDEQQDTDGDVTMEDAAETRETPEVEAQEKSEVDPDTDEGNEGETDSESASQEESSGEEDVEVEVEHAVKNAAEDEDEDEVEVEDDEDEGEDEDQEDGDEDQSEKSTGDSETSDETEIDSDNEDHIPENTNNPESCAICQNVADTEGIDELLDCNSCETHAHRKCAQDTGAFKDDGDADSWQCQNCAQNENSESSKDASKRNRSSAPRLVRDLLPVSRGVQYPDSHSIFAQPLISEGEDGGRALRKRKSPTIEPVVSDKRRRKATPKVLSALPEEIKMESATHATRRASQKTMPTARILQYRPYEKAPPHKFILAFRLEQSKIEKILNKPPRPGRRRDRRRPRKILPPPIFQPPVPKFPALPTNHLIFPSMWGDRENEANAKPYGGILSDADADTSRSLPQLKDREMFEIARKEAEEERRKTSAAAEAEINGENTNTTKPNRTVSGPPSKIKCIQFGKYVIDTFYAAPYPEEYSHESRLFICEFCLKYLPSEFVAYRHKLKCPAKHPPGDEIYRDGSISVWEVDGRKKTEYCQCLCLMAKMFLGSKTLYYDVEPFLFYILTEYDEFGYHFVGYFSKEKRPASQNNVSCILVMPIHQRKGYATFLIDFSYLLTRIEGKDGSPEKPLSDMGLTAYRAYWDLTVSKQLLDIGMNPFSTKDLMQRTGMTADDVVHSLERLYAFVKDPVTKIYAIRYDRKLYEAIVSDFETKKYRKLRPENLIWTPYIMGRSDQAHLDTQPVQTIAPREGDEPVVEDLENQEEKTKDNEDLAEDGLSPKSYGPSRQSPAHTFNTDPQLVNGSGQVAPGPPSAQLLTGHVTNEQAQMNGDADSHEEAVTEGGLTGYALAFRNADVPPSRFLIDPPIPPSMLRARSHKKRNTTFGRRAVNGDLTQSPTVMAPVRSSPRHAASTNGSVNGTTGTHSPEKPSTPVRRSSRKSGLSTVENVGLDGSMEPDEQEVGDEIEAKVESASESEGSSEDEDEESSRDGEADDVEEDEEDDDDEDDAVTPEDEEDEDEEEEEADDDDPDALDIANDSEEDEESDED